MPHIKLTNIKMSCYGDPVLDIPHLEFTGSLGVIGCCASGKTSLLKAIAGLEYIDSGEIYFDGAEIASKKIGERGICLLSRMTPLMPGKSVYYNLAYPLKKRKAPPAEIEKKVGEAARKAGLNDLKKKAKALTEQEKTDLLLARAGVRGTALVLVDEPSDFCNPVYFIKRLGEILPGRQVIFATYDFEQAALVCSEFAVLRTGRIAAFGKEEDIKNCGDGYVRAMCSE